MNISREQKAAQNDIILVELTKEDYLPGFEKKLKQYSKEMNVNGFRKGSVPIGMIKKMYGQAILAEEINTLADTALTDFIKENNIKVLGRPMLAVGQDEIDLKPNEDKNYQIKFEIGYEPSFEIALTGKTFDKPEIKITPEMVDKEIENVRNHFTKLEDSTEPIAEGDTFYFKLSNTTGFASESFASTEDLTETGAALVQGKSLSEIFSAVLPTIFNNDKLNIRKYILNLKEDNDMSEEDYQAEFTLEITQVKKKTIPTELTAEQIQAVTRDESKTTLEELRIALEDDIRKQYDQLATNFMQSDIHEHIIENTEIDLPGEFLKKWIVSEKENDITEEKMAQEGEVILRSIRWDLITNKYAVDNEIKVEFEEIKNDFKMRYQSYFAQSGYTPPADQLDKWVEDAMKDKNGLRKTMEAILDRKILDSMLTKVATKGISYTEEDFVNESKRRSQKNEAKHAHDHEGHDHNH